MLRLVYLGLALGTLLARAIIYTNPIRESTPDPFIVWDDDTKMYYLTWTTGVRLRILGAKTIHDLQHNPQEIASFQTPEMRERKELWAPEIHKVTNKWYFHYSLKQKPFVVEIGAKLTDDFNSSQPVQLTDKWGIDGTVLHLEGKDYYVWSCHRSFTEPSEAPQYNTEADKAYQSLCIAELKTPTELDKTKIGVISQPTLRWEQHGFPVNEGPAPMYWQNQTYLVYSASFCGRPEYSLGLLRYTGGDPLDKASWHKRTSGPIFQSGNGNYGTGHNTIFSSPDKTELWSVFHAVQDSNGSCGNSRAAWVEKVDTSDFDPEVGPKFPPPGRIGEELEGPSGEGEQPRPSGCLRRKR